MTAFDGLFRDLAVDLSAFFGGSLTATITTEENRDYDPAIGRRPAGTNQSYSVSVSPPYMQTRQGSTGTERVTKLFVPAKNVEGATVSGAPATPVPPGSGSKVVLSNDTKAWKVAEVEVLQSGELVAAYVLELTR